MSSPKRIAIIGIGAVAELHARALLDVPGGELVAATCRTPERGRAFAGRWNCQWFADYERMLDEAKPDVVAICTPSGAHLEPALAAIARGVHVLSEKPLEISLDRIDRMIAAAAKAGVVLGGLFPQRFNPTMIAVREAVAAGRFGQISIISIAVPWWRDDAYYAPDRWQGKLALDGGGALINQSIHAIDCLQWFAAAAMSGDATPRGTSGISRGEPRGTSGISRGEPRGTPDGKQADAPSGASARSAANSVEQVFCFTGKLAHDPAVLEVEDTAVAVMRLRCGALGQVLGTTSMYPGSLRRLLIAGRDGTIEVIEDQLTQFHFRTPRPGDEALRASLGSSTAHGGGASDPMAISHKYHAANIAEFLAAIESGVAPAIDGAEARKSVEIIHACYASAAEGRAIRLD